MANQQEEMLKNAARHGRLACELTEKHNVPAELVGRAARIAAKCAFAAKPWLRRIDE